MVDAGFIVGGMNGASIPLYDDFVTGIPGFKDFIKKNKVKKQYFEYILATAGIGIACVLIDKKDIPEVLKEAEKIHPSYVKAIMDMYSFIEKQEKNVSINISLGVWVLWALKKKAPTHEEIQSYAKKIGNTLYVVADRITKTSLEKKKEK